MSSTGIGSPAMNEPIEAIELCAHCPYDDCVSPAFGCDEMKALKAALKAGRPYDGPPENWGKEPDPQELLDAAWEKMKAEAKPKSKSKSKAKPKVKAEPKDEDRAVPITITLEELPQPSIRHIKLHHYNEAIKALEALHDSAPSLGPDIVEMITQIKTDRSARFDYLIDWDAIARGGTK